METRPCCLLVVGLLLPTVVTPAAGACQATPFQYRPAAGVTHSLHVWVEALVVATKAGVRSSDQTEARESYSRRVLEPLPAGSRLAVELDSARVRSRPTSRPWTAFTDADVDRTSVTLIVSDRGRVSALRTLDAPVLRLRPGLLAGFDISLPQNPISPGATWASEILLPTSLIVFDDDYLDTPLDLGLVVAARSTFAFDSALVRGGDTLAFLNVTGVFVPVVRSAAAEVTNTTITIDGELRGSVVWSTGWQAFAAGTLETETRLRQRTGVFGEEPVETGTVEVHVSTRFRVQP